MTIRRLVVRKISAGVLALALSAAGCGESPTRPTPPPSSPAPAAPIVPAGLTLSSSARIAGNTISDNVRHGINVERASQATISDNLLDANGQHGIFVTENSVVNLGSDTGAGLFDAPNRTVVNNALRGIACRVGGAANGRRGTLNGNAGAKDFGASCVDSLDAPDTF